MSSRLLLKDLAEQTRSLSIDVIITSYEGNLYQALVMVGSQEQLIWENTKTPLKAKNLLSMNEKLSCLNIRQIFLRQDSAYDEMIGQDIRTEPNTLKIKLGNSSIDKDLRHL